MHMQTQAEIRHRPSPANVPPPLWGGGGKSLIIQPPKFALHPKHEKRFKYQKKMHVTDSALVIQERKGIQNKAILTFRWLLLIRDKVLEAACARNIKRQEQMKVKEAVD